MEKESSLTPDQVQKAKDFIWEHLSDLGQSFWVNISSLPDDERKKRYTRKILCYLSADRKGEVITKEFAVLYHQETIESPNTDASFQV
jgi:hypothetical protein